MGHLAILIFASIQNVACATAKAPVLISKERAVEVAMTRLKTVAVCVDSVKSQEAVFFLTGREFRESFSRRGEDAGEDLVKLDRPYWSVLIEFRTRAGRPLLVGTTVDAISGQALEPPTDPMPSLCLQQKRDKYKF